MMSPTLSILAEVNKKDRYSCLKVKALSVQFAFRDVGCLKFCKRFTVMVCK